MNHFAPWKIIRSTQSEYLTIWKVQRQTQAGKETGFFKFTNRANQRYIGPLLANELICSRLARCVGLPVAKTEVATIRGKTGIISAAKQGAQLYTWNQVAKKLSPSSVFNQIIDPSRLYKTFVFDVWICNIDRSGKNIILYPKKNKYDFYLIDHELALLGAVRYENKHWRSTYWNNVLRYSKGYHPALVGFINNYSELKPYIREVQSIPFNKIRAVVATIPPNLLTPKERRLMENILLHRQRTLHSIVTSFVTSKNR